MKDFWDVWGFPIVIGSIVVLFFVGVGFFVKYSDDKYRDNCHKAGGHVIEVNNGKVCADDDMKIVIVKG